jgi:hypothetical protein
MEAALANNPATVAELPAALRIRLAGNVPVFTTAEGARFLAKPGEDVLALHNRLKGAAQRRLIHPRQRAGAGKTSPAYFGIDDLAAGVVLFALFDLGIADAEIANHASLACYAWDETLNPRPATIRKGVSPVAAAMIGAARGQFWAFKLSTFHNDQTNERRVIAAVYDMDAPPPDASQFLPPSFLPRATLTILLPPLLMPLNRAFDKPKGN